MLSLLRPAIGIYSLSSARPAIATSFNNYYLANYATSVQLQDGPGDSKCVEPDKLYRMIELELRGVDPAVMKSYQMFANMAASELGITLGECWTPRKAHHDRLTLLKSIHIYKKHRVQYEIRTYFRFMQFLRLTGSTADTFLEYIQRNLPEGVSMKVTKAAIEKIPEHLVPSNE